MTLLDSTPTEPLFDLFASTEPTQTSLGKCSYIDEDLVQRNICAKRPKDDKDDEQEEDELGLALKTSRLEKEMSRDQKHDRAMGIGPSG